MLSPYEEDDQLGRWWRGSTPAQQALSRALDGNDVGVSSGYTGPWRWPQGDLWPDYDISGNPIGTGRGYASTDSVPPEEPPEPITQALTATPRTTLPGGRSPSAHPRRGAPTIGTAVPVSSLWPATAPGTSTSTTTTTTPTSPLPPVLAGWDAGKWADPEHKSIKYVSGRIFAKYKPSDWLNPTTRDQIVAELRAAGLNPTIVGDDSIDFNDGYGPIDVVQGAGAGGQAWQWLPAGGGGGGTAAFGGSTSSAYGLSPNLLTGNLSASEMLQRALQALALNRVLNPASNPMLR